MNLRRAAGIPAADRLRAGRIHGPVTPRSAPRASPA
jgi:hypothetical protein